MKLQQEVRLWKTQYEKLLATSNTVTKEQVVGFCKNHFNPITADFFISQLSDKKTYPTALKQFALTLFFLSPKAYRYLKSLFKLPSTSTLFRMTSKWNILSGINDFIFQAIGKKTQTMKNEAKDCIICMDEMSLKSHLFYSCSKDLIVGFHQGYGIQTFDQANSALTFMARGISNNWKQPVAFFFVHNSCQVIYLTQIVPAIISKLKVAGLNVLGVISDQGSNFLKYSKKLGVTPQKPFFFVNGEKVYYFFDTPHLLKSTRNNLLKHNFQLDNGQMCQMSYIQSLYDFDKGRINRIVPKLSEIHLNPSSFQKMKVSLAAQIFSQHVASGIDLLVTFGQLRPEAIHTSVFVGDMDKLFDILNSLTFNAKKQLNRPFIGSQLQVDHLNKMRDTFMNIKVINSAGRDVTRSVKFLNGWLITISSLLLLWDDLKPKRQFICCRFLNQDCLENFFGNLRMQGGCANNPTPVQFQNSFKKILLINHFQHNERANCIDDFNEILVQDMATTSEILTADTFSSPESTKLFDGIFSINRTDYHNLEFPESNALSWVAGYLLKKCLTKHSCDVCVTFSKNHKEVTSETILCHKKAYINKNKDLFGNLMMPPTSFYAYIHELDQQFISLFPSLSIRPGIAQNLRMEIEKIVYRFPCPNFNRSYLLNLFIRMRIYYTIKYINRNFKSNKKYTKNKKLIKILHL